MDVDEAAVSKEPAAEQVCPACSSLQSLTASVLMHVATYFYRSCSAWRAANHTQLCHIVRGQPGRVPCHPT